MVAGGAAAPAIDAPDRVLVSMALPPVMPGVGSKEFGCAVMRIDPATKAPLDVFPTAIAIHGCPQRACVVQYENGMVAITAILDPDDNNVAVFDLVNAGGTYCIVKVITPEI